MLLTAAKTAVLLLFATFVGSASGATLVCHEKEAGSEHGELLCEFDVAHEEVASAWNMNCANSESGLKCSFETTRKGEKRITPTDFVMEACSEDGVCVKSVVNTALTVSHSTDGGMVSNPAFPLQQQPLHGIRVGTYEYKEPFQQYAKPIERTLSAKASLWRTPSKDMDIMAEYALANAHLDLGISHVTATAEEDYSPGTHSDRSADSFDLNLAANAFKVAEKMYLSLLGMYENEKSAICGSLGALYFQWAELYQNNHYFDGEVEGEEQRDVNKLALERYQKADKYYRSSLDDARTTPAVVKATKVHLAHASHRIGHCLVATMQVTVDLEESELDDQSVDLAAHTSINSPPQSERIVHSVTEAEKHFAEAIRLFRAAIDDEAEFSAQIRLRMNLATTLHDASVAASYASHLEKAVWLQEEGLAVSNEILPHVGISDRPFLLQYIASGMYGLANHYMLLGEYDKTKLKYKAAMEWYKKHDLSAPLTASSVQTSNDSLEVYAKQLADYRQGMFVRDDAYEGSLCAALGSIHLSRDEVLLAIQYLEEAVSLYSKKSEQNLNRSIADVKVC